MSAALLQYPVQQDSANGSNDSSSGQPSQTPQHKRVYQACIPCRRRKVKCDLGSVDNPGDPPCVRCRRESKECFFSATRRKRKNDDGNEDSLDGFEYGDDYIVRNGRKMVHTSPPASVRQSSMGAPPSRSTPWPDNSPVMTGPPLTPGGSIGRSQPLRRPTQQQREQAERAERNAEEANTHVENLEAQEVMRREVYGPHDALDLLYKAATDRYAFCDFTKKFHANLSHSPGHHRTKSSSQMSPVIGNNDSRHLPQSSPLQQANHPFQSNYMPPPETGRDAAIDPALTAEGLRRQEYSQEQGYKDAIKAWSRFRFVRAGWFTPAEAIDYIA
jgi:hypothetical protein